MKKELRRTALRGGLAGVLIGLAGVWAGYHVLGLKLGKVSAPIAYSGYGEPETREVKFAADKPRNIIIFVADGMGFAHLSLAQNTGPEAPVWHRFDVRGWHDPRPIRGPITDSAASATAMSTGRLTQNDKVGVDERDQPLFNLFEAAWANDYRTGVVTDSYIWDATPAAFVTHSASRDNAEDILRQLADSPLEVLLGELEDVGEGEVPTWDATIEILSSRYQMLGPDLPHSPEGNTRAPVAAVFPEDAITDLASTPNLKTMTDFALQRLSSAETPFLLLVESEELDSASHRRNATRAIGGIKAIEATLVAILNFAQARGDTLVVFTADHETGGLALSYDLDSYPDLVLVWGSQDHTSTVVPLLADGPGAQRFAGVQRVWEIGAALHELIQ